ncbi:MAG: 50S ribosomal protein L23 [Spirochaetales bacterium]|uniref:Large ribosomal subunit protein uL23 n=1 Tax=Candidatus Thalassospirochaeta sargassi TaxID=3119039 RepID=A0AAJ1IF46_9SPIO|nr:50S ribosomal protein L23 [Spirochaetales bacterium]
MEAMEVLIEPVLTEKTNEMRDGETRKYVFKVDPRANKIQIMGAVKELFNVQPVACNIVNVKSKPRMSRTKSGMRYGKTTPWKKAIITLKAGDKIDTVEGA